LDFTSFADGNAANEDRVAKMLGTLLTGVTEINDNRAVQSDHHIDDVQLKEENNFHKTW